MEISLNKGSKLDSGKYEYVIEKTLGKGGFGITYLASTTFMIGNVKAKVYFAIKEHFISSDCEREAGTSKVVYSNPARERVEGSKKDFLAEARRLQKVGTGHENIVKVNEIFEANNTAYYVMEYLEGESLRDYVERRGKLSEDEMWEVMSPIADAVSALHTHNMTHLDIKPENIMIVKDEEGKKRPVLIDFGLSKHYGNDGSPTSTINTLGCSDGYSPSEQYMGITSFSPESDVYALGATMYYCLTGESPKKASELRDGELASELEGKVSAVTVDALRRATRMSKFDRERDVRKITVNSGQRTEDREHKIAGGNATKVIGGGEEPVSRERKTVNSGERAGEEDEKIKEFTVPEVIKVPEVLKDENTGDDGTGTKVIEGDAGKKNNKRLITVAVLAALAGILFVCVFFMIKSEEKNEKEVEELVAENKIASGDEVDGEVADAGTVSGTEDGTVGTGEQTQTMSPEDKIEEPLMPTTPPEDKKEELLMPTTPLEDVMLTDIEMVYVPGGTFMMGASDDDPDASGSERPAHEVTLSSFRIGKYEVTQKQWKEIMGSNPSRFKGDNLPVESVTWDDVQEFISKLNARTGKNYRLPTEAEWEYAARGGNNSRGYKYSGSDNIGSVAWYDSNSNSQTHPVGSKSPNELGIYDMSGNVWEWCSDWFGEYSSGSQRNPKGPSRSYGRVLRGGSYGYDVTRSRSTCRYYYIDDGIMYYGFRLAE